MPTALRIGFTLTPERSSVTRGLRTLASVPCLPQRTASYPTRNGFLAAIAPLLQACCLGDRPPPGPRYAVAYWLALGKCRLRPLFHAVVSLPLVLPPTVLGFYLLVALGPASHWDAG